MPKVKLGTETERAKRRYNYVAGILQGGIRQKQLTKAEISNRTDMPERTVNDRLQHPENFRLSELYKLADVAGVQITFKMKDIPD